MKPIVATFYTWNVQQKDDGVKQNTLRYYYGDYQNMNLQTQINKTCCRYFASLASHLVFKDSSYYLLLAFLKVCQKILNRNITFLTFDFITTTF